MTDRLSRVAEHLRQREREGAKLDELGRAALSEEDTSALERELGVDAEAARVAYEPLGADFKERIAARVRESLANAGNTAEPARAASETAQPAAAGQSTRPQTSGMHLRRIWPASAVLAAAAALLLWLAGRGGPDPVQLAHYELEIENPVAAVRSTPSATAAADPIGVAPGSSLHLVLRPERAVSAEVGARVLVRTDAGLSQIPAAAETAAVGALRVKAELPATLPLIGTLIVIVGTTDALSEARAIAEQAAAAGPGWQRFERPFVVAGHKTSVP